MARRHPGFSAACDCLRGETREFRTRANAPVIKLSNVSIFGSFLQRLMYPGKIRV